MKKEVIFENGVSFEVSDAHLTLTENDGTVTCTIVCSLSQTQMQLLDDPIDVNRLLSGQIAMTIGSDIHKTDHVGRLTADDADSIRINVGIHVRGKKKDLFE